MVLFFVSSLIEVVVISVLAADTVAVVFTYNVAYLNVGAPNLDCVVNLLSTGVCGNGVVVVVGHGGEVYHWLSAIIPEALSSRLLSPSYPVQGCLSSAVELFSHVSVCFCTFPYDFIRLFIIVSSCLYH